MWIVLAWVEEDFRVVSDSGYDLGKAVKTEKFLIGKSTIWKREGTDADKVKAQEFAKKETFGNLDAHPQIFTYSDNESDPLTQARKDVLKTVLVLP